MKKVAATLFLTALLLPAFAQPSFADWDHDHPHYGTMGHRERADWDHGHGGDHWRGDIHHFHDYDEHYWHTGHWWHGVHGGRIGWWWVLNDGWYFYPRPIYPYPYPLAPPVVVTPAPPANYWYYCRNPAGYYPYVPQCSLPWSEVPAQ